MKVIHMACYAPLVLLMVLHLPVVCRAKASIPDQEPPSFRVKVRWEQSPEDSLYLCWKEGDYIHQFPHRYGEIPGNMIAGQRVRDGYYSFQISCQKAGNGNFYLLKKVNKTEKDPWTLHADNCGASQIYYFETGDDISIRIGSRTPLADGKYENQTLGSSHWVSFSGKGSDKYTMNYSADSIWREASGKYMEPHTVDLLSDSVHFELAAQEPLNQALAYLDRNKNKVSPILLTSMKLNTAYYFKAEILRYLHIIYSYDLPGMDPKEREKRINWVVSYVAKNSLPAIPAKTLSNSPGYMFCQYKKMELEYLLNKYQSFDEYYWMMKKYPQEVRNKMIIDFFHAILNSPMRQYESIYQDAVTQLAGTEFAGQLLPFSKRLINRPLDFSMPDTAGRYVHLHDFRNKVVLLDIWYVGCGGCAVLYKNYLSKVEEYFKQDTSVVFISVFADKSKEFWLTKGINSGNYTSPSCINLYTDGMGFDHPFLKDLQINTFPTLILVNGKGIMEKYNVAGADMPNADEVIIKAIQSVQQRESVLN